MTSGWKSKAETKRQAILDAIPSRWRLATIPTAEEQKDVTGAYVQQFLSREEIEITETDAVGIADQVSKGKWSAVQVTEAFCHRAAIAHQLVNCLHEIFFEAALDDARELDTYFQQHKKTKGPLHGVPVSLKDQFHVKNVETSMGYVGWIGTFEGRPDDPRYKTFESEMVRELRECGAVLYCKTSVPHSLMCGETINNIVGYVENPKDRYLSAGGSSGGEGALLGIRGSTVGLGTDIGGSIRIPAAFNGLYGLRPTSGRLPYEGMANSMDGQITILSVVGPLATTAGGLRLITKSLLSTSPWLHDPLVVPMPWRSSEEKQILDIVAGVSTDKLAFGVLKNDGEVTPTPPVARAIEMVTAMLQKAGHDIIEWNPPSHTRGNELTFQAFMADGGRDVVGAFALSGEQSAPQALIQSGSVGDEYTATQLAATNVGKRRWQKEYLDYWNSTSAKTASGRPVDGFICPLAPFPAARPTRFRYYGYSAFVNGLDYPSVIVPVTNVDKSVDQYPVGWKALNETDQQVADEYDAELADGAHVSVQVVGRRFAEERMIAIAGYIGSLLSR